MTTPRFEPIDDAVAIDHWHCRRGPHTFTARIEIGRPVPATDDPNGDWCCSVFVETFNSRIMTVMGVGPIDALLNATDLIRKFAEDLDEWSPRAEAT